MRKLFSTLTLAVATLVAVGCNAESGSDAKYEANKHYRVLEKPVATTDPSRVEVAEVFRYGCPHCRKFSPIVSEWASQFPEQVNFVRNPVAMGFRNAELHTRAYYAANSMGVVDKVHDKLFDAMHVQKKTLKNQREIAEVFVDAGIDKDKFTSVFQSFGIISQSMKAESRGKGYRIHATPCIIINGKYRVGGDREIKYKSHDEILEVAKYLIEREINGG